MRYAIAMTALVAAMLCCTGASCLSAVAWGEEGSLLVAGSGPLDGPLVTPDSPLEGEAIQVGEKARLASPEAVLAREQSRTAFQGLDQEEAAKVAQETFPELIEQTVGDLPALPSDEHIAGYPSDDSARIELPGGKHAVVQSSAPIAAEIQPGQFSPLDLSLDGVAGAFEPATSAIEVRLPRRLSDGADLKETGVSLTPVDGRGTALGGSEGVSMDAAVFYANTQTDADTVIKPVPLGLEVTSLLRSIESPERLASCDRSALNAEKPRCAGLFACARMDSNHHGP